MFAKSPRMWLTNMGLRIFRLIDFLPTGFHQVVKLCDGLGDLEGTVSNISWWGSDIL